MAKLQLTVDQCHTAVMDIQETWLQDDHTWAQSQLEGYKEVRATTKERESLDRTGKIETGEEIGGSQTKGKKDKNI